MLFEINCLSYLECVTKETYELRQKEVFKMEKEVNQLRDEVAMLKVWV